MSVFMLVFFFDKRKAILKGFDYSACNCYNSQLKGSLSF